MKPVRYDNDIPVFSTRDIDDYGFPEIYGYTKYLVIESRELNAVTEYKMEHEYDLRPIHRYSRLARFKSTLFQLLGERGHIPPIAFNAVKTYLKPDSKNKWEDARKLLKHFNQRKCYDRIPIILSKLGYGRSFPSLTSDQIIYIINDFCALSDTFERTKHKYSRRYFPNIRYIVLKLLELHGITSNYPLPFVRTDRKRLSLDTLWDQLVKSLKK
jgi:hypothetical protein